MSKRILLIEDDKRLSELMANFLNQQDFVVKCLYDSVDLQQTMNQFAPDIIILDIMLPGEDGFELCKKLRTSFTGPLLFVTAKSSDFDQVLGLELGADDYVIKPVEPRVLLARINALLRRSEGQNNETQIQSYQLKFGELSINRNSREVFLANDPIQLTSHEFDMLWKLATNPSKLVERETLYSELIGREYDGLDRSADVRISRLRKKLRDNPQNPYRIKTIWGKGFFFVPDAWE
ncbi:response regulator [Aliiglaciecola lipolytica]|uniref:Transcriptional regulatory protein ompR n=1 Tax=Aliiglaciecola lipolytica E3 TaxID=1127673 RepID=K6XUS2_9ALTE|nr:response regulator [Aliiglaciecola lipolytica]GAC15411.1 transcriptional regulatory protein ompR [Aliiglaciecola lipolytica E3]